MASQQSHLSQEQLELRAEEYKKFESIIYSNLEKILEKRPFNPVTKFSEAILADIGLDKKGRPMKKKEKKEKKKKKKDKGSDDESKKSKDEKKDDDSSSDDDKKGKDSN